jgi:hypothetical protein
MEAAQSGLLVCPTAAGFITLPNNNYSTLQIWCAKAGDGPNLLVFDATPTNVQGNALITWLDNALGSSTTPTSNASGACFDQKITTVDIAGLSTIYLKNNGSSDIDFYYQLSSNKITYPLEVTSGGGSGGLTANIQFGAGLSNFFTLAAETGRNQALAIEYPFCTITLSGPFTNFQIISDTIDGSEYGPTLFDAQGNVLATSKIGIGNGVTLVPDTTDTTPRTYFMDTTGLQQVIFDWGAGATGTATVNLSFSKTQNSIFNSLPKKRRRYFTQFKLTLNITGDIFYLPGVAKRKVKIECVFLTPVQASLGTIYEFKKGALAAGGTFAPGIVVLADSDLPVNLAVPNLYSVPPGTPSTAPLVFQFDPVNQSSSTINIIPVNGITLNGVAENFIIANDFTAGTSVADFLVVWTEE